MPYIHVKNEYPVVGPVEVLVETLVRETELPVGLLLIANVALVA